MCIRDRISTSGIAYLNGASCCSDIVNLTLESNSIVLAKDNALIGMGAGQPNRVTSVHLALKIAGDRTQGTVLASDAFFPFADGIELAASGGVTAVIEPGGSVRDADIIETADRLNLALIFTGYRHFRH